MKLKEGRETVRQAGGNASVKIKESGEKTVRRVKTKTIQNTV